MSFTSPTMIVQSLTPDQKKCLVNLTSDWSDTGYCKVNADLLYALGGSDLWPDSPPLVDCDFYKEENRSGRYRHRLLPHGLLIKELLL